jgi:hypothetical protein
MERIFIILRVESILLSVDRVISRVIMGADLIIHFVK